MFGGRDPWVLLGRGIFGVGGDLRPQESVPGDRSLCGGSFVVVTRIDCPGDPLADHPGETPAALTASGGCTVSVIEATILSRPPAIHSFASTWLSPAREENFALPTVSNFHGYLQVAWGPSGIQNWVVPPSGYPTPTGILYRLDGTVPTRVEPEGTR